MMTSKPLVSPMVKDGLLIAILLLARATGGFSQSRFELQIGARVGLPFSISMESKFTGVAGASNKQAYDRAPFSVAPTLTAIFYDRVTVGLDALYKPVRGRGAASSPTFTTTNSTQGSSWEFPLVADYHFLKSPVRLYLGGGLVVAETTTGTTEIRTTEVQTGATTVRTEQFRASPSQLPAYVVNGGLEWRRSRVVIRPELRFTRWSRVSQYTNAARHLNQFEYLIGFSFRGYEH
jgi:hypothetical protein